ncbi:MAG: PD40 domain-containing protein [Bacteroidales bacterium]|nr:PD40 domain-containing protein [Bacteroidales bacterium]
MSRGKTLLYILISALFAASTGHPVTAQTDSLVLSGDALRKAYRFEESLDVYEQALDSALAVGNEALADLVRDRTVLSENGRNMSRFVQKPTVIAKRLFSLDEFFLYYPLEDRSWRALPNPLDSSSTEGLVRALFAPDWNDVIYFSAEGDEGVRNLYVTEQQDTVWSVPVLLEKQSTTDSNEIYPMLSPDGKTLYFSSKGFYGAGGYDLYKSVLDEATQTWSVPQNMGFPYSSPADDFLYVESEDGEYAVFASNRECPADSVWVYVLQYEDYPVHSAVTDPDELLELSRLDPPVSEAKKDKADIPHSALTLSYMEKMSEVRSLRDSLQATNAALEALRTDFAFSNDAEERMRLTQQILGLETGIPSLLKALEGANSELRDIEMEFRREGVFISTEMAEEEDDSEPELPEYDFRKMSMGDPLDIDVLEPEVKFDYTFQILPEAQFAEDQSIPSGIIYQIQLFSGGRKALPAELKGLSPIYEHRTPSGMYTYRVGRFGAYEDALASVDKVRARGFRSAYIVAFIDGDIVSVSEARTAEAKAKNVMLMYEVRIMPETGELDREVVEGIVTLALGKDIARVETEDGTQVFIVGPFDDKTQADNLVEFVKSKGSAKVTCELLGNEIIVE